MAQPGDITRQRAQRDAALVAANASAERVAALEAFGHEKVMG